MIEHYRWKTVLFDVIVIQIDFKFRPAVSQFPPGVYVKIIAINKNLTRTPFQIGEITVTEASFLTLIKEPEAILKEIL